jgi:hypothetical protein
MSGVFLLISVLGGIILFLALIGVIYSLRNFSRSNRETVVDDKLWQAMITDEALSPELKKAIAGHNKKKPAQDAPSVTDTENSLEQENREGEPLTPGCQQADRPAE